MNSIILHNLNPVIFEKISSLAQEHNRTLEDEIKTLLGQLLEVKITPQISARDNFRAKLEAARQKHHQIFSDSTELLREDRNCCQGRSNR